MSKIRGHGCCDKERSHEEGGRRRQCVMEREKNTEKSSLLFTVYYLQSSIIEGIVVFQ